MNKRVSFYIMVASLSLIALVSAGTAGAQNTNFGTGALPSASASNLFDSAFGFEALASPTSGIDNTALGAQALFSNAGGNGNAATGFDALFSNTTGNDNTASGSFALTANTTGFDNTGSGFNALNVNTTGINNTASGGFALIANTTGSGNTASGAFALGSISGNNNTASGFQALLRNAAGNNNTAVGDNALLNSTGNHNIALGFNAGANLTSGDKNVDIGNPGAAAESATIRIGKEGIQTAAYMAGISGSLVTGEAVMVSNTGQLGVVLSSARYKRDIHDMGQSSDNLMKLRPVTFRYKADPAGTLQYGLVAEEVAKLYPELVTRGIDGRVQSVRYTVLTAMLLNELQKQARENSTLAERNRKLAAAVAELKTNQDRQQVAFEHRFATLEREMASKAGGGQLASAFNR